jgi:allantoate deiminase
VSALASSVDDQARLAAVTRSVAARLRAVSLIGRDPGGGWSRLAFTRAEREAHALFRDWAEELGLAWRQDAIGNSYARLGDQEGPALVIGSHLDTVPQGGNFDGVAGVVAGVEAASLLRSGGLRHAVQVVVFSAEEGARFASPCLGSRAITGALTARELGAARDVDGVSALDAARSAGLHPEDLARDAWAAGSVACYLELHIEQGRVLEEARLGLGIVEAIAGATRLAIVLRGRADHSGATPMPLRRDALAGAAEVVGFVERAGARSRTTVATVGRLQVSPNSITTVPGEVRLSIDVRDIDPLRQRQVVEEVLEQVARVCSRRGLEGSARLLHDQSPFVLHYWVREHVAAAADEAGLPYKVMPSGAGHDAGYVSLIAPSGLVFVPSRAGISHAPEEWSEAEDIAKGAVLLADALARIDRAEGTP